MKNDILKEKIINRIIVGKIKSVKHDDNCWGNSAKLILYSGDFFIILHKYTSNEFMKHDTNKTNPEPSYTIDEISTSDGTKISLGYEFNKVLDADIRIIELIKGKFNGYYKGLEEIRRKKQEEKNRVNEELLKTL